MNEEIALWKRFAMQRKEGKLMERAPQDRDMSGAEDAIPNFVEREGRKRTSPEQILQA
jgi:hypothetical protein